nr:MAG TPA_asm: DNA repair exonuclease [Caudoviricetes sp.]
MKQVIDFINKDLFVEAHIADLHFGVMDPLKEFRILQEQFLNYIDSMNVLDIVSINGDIFDRKLLANSDAVMYAMYFVQNLVNICIRKNATIILISGTASHDADQLKLFTPFIRSGVDIRIIFETQFIFVKGKKILCIPEMYNMGEEYYLKYLQYSGLYDSCYMHGTFMGAIRGKDEANLNSNREPVFSMDHFASCKGPIISGHNHVNSVYKKDFYYCGSPIRWRFGEEGEKGFLILVHNLVTRKYLVHLEPIYSFRYDTINLDDMLKSDPRFIIDYINKLKSDGIDFIRIKFTKNDSEKISILKSYFNNRSDIKIEANFEREKIKRQLQEMDEKYQEYDYLFDDNLSSKEKLVQYINQQENSTYWTLDNFESFVNEIKNL